MNPTETEGPCGSDEVEGKEIDRAMTGDYRSSCLTFGGTKSGQNSGNRLRAS